MRPFEVQELALPMSGKARSEKRPMPRPTALGILMILAAAVMLVIGARSRNPALTLSAALLLGIIGASAYLTVRNVERAVVERDTTLRGQVGHPVPFRLEVTSPRSLGGFLIAKDRNFGVRPALVPTKGGRYEGSWLLLLTQRGRWTELRTALACSMPMGLFVAKREFKSDADVEIGPATSEVELPAFLQHVDGPGERQSRPPRAGRGIDYLNIREYRHGDRIRHIHWRASARHDDLLVREFESEGHATLVVALDTQGVFRHFETEESSSYFDLTSVTPAAPSVSLGDYASERAVSVAASIALAALREGDVVYLLTASQGLVKARSREEVMSFWANVEFGMHQPVTRLIADIPPRTQLAIVGAGPLIPYISEIPESSALFLVSPPVWSPVPTWYVPMEGPLCFLPQPAA
ncbi:MAG: hypothetical protein DCC49_05445 [Acidobacteria bacterium]|nr:MAG: hypothetical protein DCC49_05445 [Acidobacteriota bacterium]